MFIYFDNNPAPGTRTVKTNESGDDIRISAAFGSDIYISHDGSGTVTITESGGVYTVSFPNITLEKMFSPGTTYNASGSLTCP